MIENSAAFKNNGAIVIWNDETEAQDASDPNQNDFGHTMVEIVISPLARGNAYASALNYTHSSDLKTLQELFNVTAPGGGFLGDANTPGTNDLSDMFKSSPTITSSASPGVTPLSPTGATLSDSAVLANGFNETGNLVFTLTGPNGFSSTVIDPLSAVGNGTYNASVALPAGATPGTYTWSVSYAGDVNNLGAKDQGGAAEQTIVVGSGATQVGNVLYVVGGNTNDQLNVDPTGASKTGSTGIKVSGKLNSVDIHNQTFSGVNSIYVYLYDGNNNVQFANSITLTTIVSAGKGNNHITLGDGNNDSVTIVGDGNNQVAVGNGMNDVISIVGNGDDDVTTGSGSGTVHFSGAGHKKTHLGSSGWQII
jgi:hypothetical protein